MAGHYTFTSPNDPSSYIPGGQSNTPSQMNNNHSPNSHHYGSSISFSTPSHVPSYSTSNGMNNMGTSGYPQAFSMPVPIQDPFYNGNTGQPSHVYSPQPGVPSVKWPPNGAWSSPIINQGINDSWSNLAGMPSINRPRPKLTTTLWEDENTVCFQVDAKGICVARRQDNDMVNGTKLLNVTGMSRGKRDGILKNEKGRVVVKVGAMHLKGVWITIVRAKALAAQYKISDLLYPLLVDDPSPYLYSPHYPPGMPSSRIGLPHESSPYITSFSDPSLRGQTQQHFMVGHSRMGYGSPVVPINDPHNVGVIPQSSQSRQYSIPYRYPGGNTHTQSHPMTHPHQGMEPYLIPEGPRINSRSPLLQGNIDHHEGSVSGDSATQPLMNPGSHHQQPNEYTTDNQYTRPQPYDMQNSRKISEHQLAPSSSTIVNKKRNFSEDIENESANDGQFPPDPSHSHHGAMYAPLGGRGYSFPSPCSLPSPSMSQIQQDMSPVNKRTKVLRYDSNPHSGYIDPHYQQTKPIESNRISAAEGQEPMGLIFGTLSPPESETEGYIDHTHSKSSPTRGYSESAPTRYNNEGHRYSYSNTKQILS